MLDQVAEVFSLFSNSTRIQILTSLWEGPSNVGDLAKKVGVSLSGVSQHLAKLSLSGYVDRERRAQSIVYTLSQEKKGIVKMLMKAAEGVEKAL